MAGSEPRREDRQNDCAKEDSMYHSVADSKPQDNGRLEDSRPGRKKLG